MMWRDEVRIATLEGFEVITFQGEEMGLGALPENVPLARLLALSWIALLSDSPLEHTKPGYTIRTFARRLKSSLVGAIAQYSSLAHRLTLSVEIHDGIVVNTTYLKELEKTPIYREYHEFLKTKDPNLFRYVYSFLSFGKKFDMRDQSLEQSALRGWLEVEANLQPSFLGVAAPLKLIITRLLENWYEADFLPVHGGGSVAEKGVRTVTEKNTEMKIPATIRWLYDEDSFPSEWGHGDLSRKVARLKFVAKSYKSMRSICMEPIALQWAQQGVRLWMEKAISDGCLRRFVNLKRQRINQSAAEFGSLTGLVDTIDLSSASDSVAWELVRAVFPTRVVKHLLATRSTATRLPNGELYFHRKYAPMGSALCFPTQTILYSAVCILATVFHFLDTGSDDIRVIEWLKSNDFMSLFGYNLSTRNHTLYQPFRCYGDDIICDKRVTSNVIGLLEQLSFRVNAEKSYFSKQAFRESCGGHYLFGNDVTPLYFKVDSFGKELSIEQLAGAIECANNARSYGYLKLRSVLVNFAKHYPIKGVQMTDGVNPILFSSDPESSMSIFCDKPRNTHLRRRSWKDSREDTTASRFQRDEVRSVTSRAIGTIMPIRYDRYHYIAWCRSRYHDTLEQPSLAGVMAAEPIATGVGWRWTPSN